MHNSATSCRCKICDSTSAYFGEATILKKYLISYYRCGTCGFIQTESPYWLEEAYSSAIARQDVGIMQRNQLNCLITSAVLKVMFPSATTALDFGAGHGIFVRLMRDGGYDFSWSDLHAENNYARGFEFVEGKRVDLVTGFEVLEHLADPIAQLADLMDKSDNVLVSTCLIPEPPPALGDWWYFLPSSGQHISFYSSHSLRLIASRFSRNLLSVGQYHLFTRDPKSSVLFKIATMPRAARVINAVVRRPSLMDDDFKRLSQ